MDLSLKVSDESNDNVPDQLWDVIVIGAGPGGFSASIYSTRYGLSSLIIGKEVGGLATENPIIENYPGFESIDGKTLTEKFKNHNKSLGGYLLEKEVLNIKKEEDHFVVSVESGDTYSSKTLIYSGGTKRRKLNVPGEDKLFGKGVTYCATCDAPFTKGKKVGVIGGGDSGFISALQVSEYAEEVNLIHRREEFRAVDSLVKKAKEKGINFVKNVDTISFEGEENLTGIKLLDKKKDEEFILDVSHAFIEIGHIPTTDLVSGLGVELDGHGYVDVNDDMSTNIKGLFAAGDCTNGSNNMNQIITACSEGAIASEAAYKLLKH
ncbi:MAG: NAD(P)/FAD-dependent oxidoreductase [Halanaerobiales bacterium]